jgi:hypothetical protein
MPQQVHRRPLPTRGLRQDAGSIGDKKVTDRHATWPTPTIDKDDFYTVHGVEDLGHLKQFTVVSKASTDTDPDAGGGHCRPQIF